MTVVSLEYSQHFPQVRLVFEDGIAAFGPSARILDTLESWFVHPQKGAHKPVHRRARVIRIEAARYAITKMFRQWALDNWGTY